MPVLTPGTPFVSADPVLEVEGLAVGTHRFRLEVEDEAGNRSAAAERQVTVRPAAPVINGFQPGYGAWGAQVLITGSGFDPEPRKNQPGFSAGVRGTVIAGTATELRVGVPQPAITGPVTLVNGAGTATSPRPFIVPRSFELEPAGAPLLDLAHEPLRNEVWVLHGQAGSDFGAVSMLSLGTRERLGTVVVQAGPRELAIAGDSLALAAVSNAGSSTVTVIDVRSRKAITHLRVAPGPAGLAFRPGGNVLYVACDARVTGAAAASSVDVIEVGTGNALRLLVRIEMARGATRVVFSPDGKLAFVNEVGNGTVAMIDASAHRVIQRFKVGGAATSAPSEVAVSRGTFPLLVANPGTRNASVLLADGSVKNLDIGQAVAAAAIDDTGGWLGGPDAALVFALDLTALRLRKVAVAAPGAGPKSVVVSPQARGVWAASPTTNTVTVLDPATRALRAVVPVAEGPVRGVLSADGRLACFLCAKAQRVAVVEAASVLAG